MKLQQHNYKSWYCKPILSAQNYFADTYLCRLVLVDGKTLNYLHNVHEDADLEDKVLKFNKTATHGMLMCVLNNLKIPAHIVIKCCMDVIL